MGKVTITEYTIVIPVYNEEKNIEKVIKSLGIPTGCKEIIVVDDGSIDRTAELAREYNITVISHETNGVHFSGQDLKPGFRDFRN